MKKSSLISDRASFIALLCLLLSAGFLATTLVSYYVSRDALRESITATELPLTSRQRRFGNSERSRPANPDFVNDGARHLPARLGNRRRKRCRSDDPLPEGNHVALRRRDQLLRLLRHHQKLLFEQQHSQGRQGRRTARRVVLPCSRHDRSLRNQCRS